SSFARSFTFVSWLELTPFFTCFPYTALFRSSDSGHVFQNISMGQTTTVTNLSKLTKYAITYHPHLDSYFLFGGLDEERNFSNDLDRKSTRLNSSHVKISYAVLRLTRKG